MGRSTINASLASKTLLSTGIPVNTVAISVPSALDGLRRSFSHRVRVAARSDGRFGVECVFLEKCWSKRWRVHAVPGGTRPPVGLSRILCKSRHMYLSILALIPSSHSSWLRTWGQPDWWQPSPHLA